MPRSLLRTQENSISSRSDLRIEVHARKCMKTLFTRSPASTSNYPPEDGTVKNEQTLRRRTCSPKMRTQAGGPLEAIHGVDLDPSKMRWQHVANEPGKKPEELAGSCACMRCAQ